MYEYVCVYCVVSVSVKVKERVNSVRRGRRS
jgi:hypothetical protein